MGPGDLVEVDQIVPSDFREPVDDLFGQIAVRIQERESTPLSCVLKADRAQEGRFAHPCPSDHIQMMQPISLTDTKELPLVPPVGCSNQSDRVW